MGAWRETVLFESRPIEVLAHDLSTLAYFCREADRPSGRSVLPTMVADGIIARNTLRLGPIPLDADALRRHRHVITNPAVASSDDRDEAILIAVGGAPRRPGRLRPSRGRSLERFRQGAAASAVGINPSVAERFKAAFGTLFATGEAGPVRALVEAVLPPHGSMLREGFRQAAPAAWRDAVDLPWPG